MCESNSKARILVSQGGISLNNEKISSTNLELKKEDFKKKIFVKLEIKNFIIKCRFMKREFKMND